MTIYKTIRGIKTWFLFIILLQITVTGCSQIVKNDTKEETMLSVVEAIKANDTTKFYRLVDDVINKIGLSNTYIFIQSKVKKFKGPVQKTDIALIKNQSNAQFDSYNLRIFLNDESIDYLECFFLFEKHNNNKILRFNCQSHLFTTPTLIQAPIVTEH